MTQVCLWSWNKDEFVHGRCPINSGGWSSLAIQSGEASSGEYQVNFSCSEWRQTCKQTTKWWVRVWRTEFCNLYFTKGIGAVHSAVRLINEFSAKGWKKNTLNDFVKRLKQTRSITKKSGSSRPRGCQSAPYTTNSSHGHLIKQSIHHITVVICKMGIAQVWKAVWEMPCKKSVKCVRYVYAKSATASRTQLAVMGN